jgi:hypothetical protein
LLVFWSLKDLAELANGPTLCKCGGKNRELVSFATSLALGGVALEKSTVQGVINDLQ